MEAMLLEAILLFIPRCLAISFYFLRAYTIYQAVPAPAHLAPQATFITSSPPHPRIRHLSCLSNAFCVWCNNSEQSFLSFIWAQNSFWSFMSNKHRRFSIGKALSSEDVILSLIFQPLTFLSLVFDRYIVSTIASFRSQCHWLLCKRDQGGGVRAAQTFIWNRATGLGERGAGQTCRSIFCRHFISS